MVPSSGFWRVANVRIKVDLPAPLGPSRPNRPGPKSRLILFIAWTSPKRLWTFFIDSMVFPGLDFSESELYLIFIEKQQLFSIYDKRSDYIWSGGPNITEFRNRWRFRRAPFLPLSNLTILSRNHSVTYPSGLARLHL